MDARWQRLGDAAGTKGVGVNRVQVAPGKLPTPPHSHGASEELFFVLAGSGLAWQDGEVHEVRPLDCVIHRGRRARAHVRRRARGPRVSRLRDAPSHRDRLAAPLAGNPHRLALGRGSRRRSLGRGGRGGAARLRRAGPETGEHRQRRRGRAGGVGAFQDGLARDKRALGAGRVALGDARRRQARRAALPLRGRGSVRDPRRRRDPRADAVTAAQERVRRSSTRRSRLRAGHVVARPPGTGIAHSFLAGGAGRRRC